MNVKLDFRDGRLPEPVVGLAEVDAGVVPGDLAEGHGQSLLSGRSVWHLPALLASPLDLRDGAPLGHLARQGHAVSRLGHDDPVGGGGFNLRTDWKEKAKNSLNLCLTQF